VPNVAFISESFMPIALAQRVMQGMPDQPVIRLPEMVSKTVDEVHAIADDVYPQLIEALLG
jgi:hypothetical protein